MKHLIDHPDSSMVYERDISVYEASGKGIPATLYNMNKIKRNILFSAYQYPHVNWRPFYVSCFLFLPSVCSCSAITVLHSASMAVIHVITTLFLWQPESVVECLQLSKIRSPLLNLHLVERGRVGAWSSDKRGRRRQRGVLLTGWRVSTLPFLQRDIIDGYISLDAWSPDTFEHHLQREMFVMCSALQDHKNRIISR